MADIGFYYRYNSIISVRMKNSGKLLVLVALLCIIPFISAATSYYTLQVNPNPFYSPSNPFPGDEVVYSVKVEGKTTGSGDASDVNAEISFNEGLFLPIKSKDILGEIKQGDSSQAVFNFKIKDETPAGLYKFPIKLTYNNKFGLVTETFDVNLLVRQCFSLDIGGFSLSPSQPYAGEKFNISVDVLNTCTGIARSATVELKKSDSSSFDPFVLLSPNTSKLGDISPGSSKTVNFSLMPIADATPGVYNFNVDLNCFDCSSKTSKISLEVLSKPVVIFSGIDLSIEGRDGSKLLPGDSFSVSVQLDNIGKEQAKAVKVFLLVDDGITGVKEAFVGNIDEDDSGAAIFDLVIQPTASSGAHNSVIKVEYLDETGNKQEIAENYEIYVNQGDILPLIISLIFLLILLAVVLAIAYFIVRMVLRQRALKNSGMK
jgi:hypothetical protein